VYQDALKMLKLIIDEKRLQANAVFGFWPANSVGDDIEVYTDESRSSIVKVLHTLRQQNKKAPGQANYALADMIAPKDAGRIDYIGAFAVTAGIGIEQWLEKYKADHDDYNAIMMKTLADRLAEAFAERLHHLVRTKYWAYVPEEILSNEELIAEKYQGIRPAPGYPACPDHTEKASLFEMLDATKAAGIQLTESFAMYPAAAVSGWYFANPGSKYFGLGKIMQDQIADYSVRKNMPVEDLERWLGSVLAYEPGMVSA
ncbi:MAG: methionine synthase, partial [Bacteroidia bacterium]|nr:methionine synthase [Bacteroidia bacterium]